MNQINRIIFFFLLIYKANAQQSGLIIEDESGSDVFLNGKIVGKTPFNKILNTGTYNILVKGKHKEYFVKTYSTTIKLVNGKIEKIIPDFNIDLGLNFKQNLKEVDSKQSKFDKCTDRIGDLFFFSSKLLYNNKNQRYLEVENHEDDYIVTNTERDLIIMIFGRRKVGKYLHMSNFKVYDLELNQLYNSSKDDLSHFSSFLIDKNRLLFDASNVEGNHSVYEYNIINKTTSNIAPGLLLGGKLPNNKFIVTSTNNYSELRTYDNKILKKNDFKSYGAGLTFDSGLFPVGKGDLTGFVDEDCNIKIPIQYSGAVNQFSNGYCVIDGRNQFIINTKGEKIGKDYYKIDYKKLFKDSYVAFQVEDGKWGFLDNNGNKVIENQYSYGNNFSENFAVVEKNNKEGLINKKNEIVIPFGVFEFQQKHFEKGEILIWCPETQKNYILNNKYLIK